MPVSTREKPATRSQERSSPAVLERSETVVSSSSATASGLTLVTASIALWNTVYIERAVQASARNGNVIDPELLKYLSHSDGSTSISPAITSGRVKSQLKGDSGRSMHRIIVKGSLHHPRRIFPIPRSVN
jgi:hypothetical protein